MDRLNFFPVKKFALAVIAGCLSLFLQAQTPAALSTDSSRFIELREVHLQDRAGSPRQKLVSFYRANPNFTLEDIMARLPEVSFVRRGAYGMEPTIRGFSGGQINVLVDGMRIYGACTDKMDPPTIYIEPTNLDHIQVQSMQGGTMHGSAIGGSVLLSMAEPKHEEEGKLHATLSSGYGSAAKSWYESLQLHYGKGRWSFLANGTYRKSSDYRAGGGEIIPFSGMEKVNYNLSAKYRLNENLSLKADLLGDDGWNIGYPALPMDVGYAAARIGSLSIQSEKPAHGWNSWNAKLYANRVRHYMDDTQRPNVPIHMDMPGLSSTVGAFAEGSRKVLNRGTLRLRGDVSSTFLTASMTMYPPNEAPMYMLTWPDHRKLQAGTGTTFSQSIDSNWSVQASARIDYIRHQLTSTEGKQEVAILGYSTDDRIDLLKNLSATITRKLFSRSQAYLTIGYAERVPTGSELYGFYLFNAQDGFDYIGKADLRNETALQSELGLRGRWGENGTVFQYQLTAFASWLSQYITGIVEPGLRPMTIGANGVKSYQNLPGALQAGGEAMLNAQFGKPWQAVATLRYTYGRDNEGNPLPFIPPLKSILSLRYQPGRFSAQAEWEAATAQDRFARRAGEDMTPGFMLVHLRFGYTIPVWKVPVGIQAGVDNLFDERYHEHLDWGNIPRQGRNIYIQVNLHF
jgi:iron complex outermembrane receptor protein